VLLSLHDGTGSFLPGAAQQLAGGAPLRRWRRTAHESPTHGHGGSPRASATAAGLERSAAQARRRADSVAQECERLGAAPVRAAARAATSATAAGSGRGSAARGPDLDPLAATHRRGSAGWAAARRSSRRPGEAASTEHVEVDVEDALAGAGAALVTTR